MTTKIKKWLAPVLQVSASRTKTASTYLVVQVATALLTIGISVLISRILGPEGRGEIAFAVGLAALIAQVANLGIPSSSSFMLARKERFTWLVTLSSLLFSIIVSIVALPVVKFAYEVNAAEPLPRLDLLLIAGLVGSQTFFAIAGGIYTGLSKAVPYAATQLLGRVLVIGMCGWAAATIGIDTRSYLLMELIASLILCAVLYIRLRPDFKGNFRKLSHKNHVVRYLFVFGLRSYAGLLFAFMLRKFDLLMVGWLHSDSEVGLYANSSMIAEIPVMIAAIIGSLTLPAVVKVRDPSKRWELSRHYARIALVILLGVAVGIALPLPWAMPFFFGPEFAGSVVPTFILLPAAVSLGINTFSSHYLLSSGAPRAFSVIWASSVGLNVSLNLFFIPTYGAVGAAVASLISYAAITGAFYYYCMKTAYR